MEFRILGPLEVADDGRAVTIRRGKEQALLAYLLLHANEVVPSGRLIDALWDEHPPATASKILHNAVSRLRRELGEGRLLTRDPGYILRVERGELDALEFERLAREGRSEDALALWRGSPLVDLQDERFADDARRHLEELRLGVLEDRIEADLAAGRQAELIPELEQLVAEHPLRERLRGLQMRALYGAGRQADALDAYRDARRTLSNELGLEPGPELQELERKILNQELDVAPAHRRAPPGRVRPTRRRLLWIAVGAAAVVAAATVGLVYAFGDSAKPIVIKPNSVVAVDPDGNRVVGFASVGASPRGVAVTNDSVWVANSADGTVSRIDADTLAPMQTIGIAAQATELVGQGGAVWVATGIDNTLVKLDARTGGHLGTFRLGPSSNAAAYAVTAGDESVWVVSGSRALQIDPRTDEVVKQSCCGSSLRDIAYGANGIWVAELTEIVARVSPITAKVTGTVSMGVVPTAVAAGFGSVWVGASDSPRPRLLVWRLDPSALRITQTISLGTTNSFLGTVDVAVGAGAVWATNYEEGTLIRIDPVSGEVTKRIKLGQHPRGIAIGHGRVWVAVD
jgi:DNA-binding SARP family transcriptional activator/DNA-binding beta-propeller fold protein YncE